MQHKSNNPFEELAGLKGHIKPNAENVIDSFTGRYAFLSESYPASITYAGTVFPSVLHAFQASKTKDTARHAMILMIDDAHEVKKFSWEEKVQWQWLRKKLRLRLEMRRQQFEYGSEMAGKLLDTGDAKIVFLNRYLDRYWGATRRKNGPYKGDNHDGKIVMQVRDELRFREKLHRAFFNASTNPELVAFSKAKHALQAFAEVGVPYSNIYEDKNAYDNSDLVPRALVLEDRVEFAIGEYSRPPIVLTLQQLFAFAFREHLERGLADGTLSIQGGLGSGGVAIAPPKTPEQQRADLAAHCRDLVRNAMRIAHSPQVNDEIHECTSKEELESGQHTPCFWLDPECPMEVSMSFSGAVPVPYINVNLVARKAGDDE